MKLTDDAFSRLVAEDVKNRISKSQKSLLREPENYNRWQTALENLLENLEDQLLDLDDQEEIEVGKYRQLGKDGEKLIAELRKNLSARRSKISRFRFYVETRLDEVKRLRTTSSASPEERGKASDFYRNAIMQHKQILMDEDYEFSEVDEALWATLEGRWEFDSL
jgi:hypothetical protein